MYLLNLNLSFPIENHASLPSDFYNSIFPILTPLIPFINLTIDISQMVLITESSGPALSHIPLVKTCLAAGDGIRVFRLG